MKNLNDRPAGKSLAISLFVGFMGVGALAIPTLGFAEKSKVDIVVSDSVDKEAKKYCEQSECSEDFQKKLVEAENGNADAQNKVGESLHFAKGVKQNYPEALKWYLQSVKKQHAKAANHIGRIYINGEGVSKNPVEACNWYIKSGEWGHAWGMMNAASCYEHGHGSSGKNMAKADEWYQRAEKTQPGILKKYEKLIAENKAKKSARKSGE